MTEQWDGRPENPERDGWHFLQHPEDLRPVPTPWDAAHAAWCSGGMHSPQGVVELGYHYVGPCLTPAEVAAREAAARREGIEAARPLLNAADEVLAGLGRGECEQHMLNRLAPVVADIRALLEDGR